MKLRTIAATTALAGALALTACGNSASPQQLNKPQPTPAAVTQAAAPAPAPAPAAAAPAPAAVTPDPVAVTPDPSVLGDAVFIANVRSHTTTLGNSDDANLISTVKSACGALDDGNSMQRIVGMVVDTTSNLTLQRDLGYMLGAGIQQYCPQYASQLSQYLP